MNLNNTQQNFHILYMQTEMYQHVYNIDSKMYLYLINLKTNPWDKYQTKMYIILCITVNRNCTDPRPILDMIIAIVFRPLFQSSYRVHY